MSAKRNLESVFVVHCLHRSEPWRPEVGATMRLCDRAFRTKAEAVAFVEENATLTSIYWWEEAAIESYKASKKPKKPEKPEKPPLDDKLALEQVAKLRKALKAMVECEACSSGSEFDRHTCGHR